MSKVIRVLVAEDSPTVRAYLVELFQSEPGLEVVGEARDGEEAVRQAVRLRPDVITMDIHMPRLNGLEATQRIMQEAPTRIIVVSSSLDNAELDLTFSAIQAGALGALDTPGGAETEQASERLIAMVKAMAEVTVVRRWARAAKPLPVLGEKGGAAAPPTPRMATAPATRVPARIVGIAASTGGPGTLETVLSGLPRDFPVPILIVQHISPGFALGLVNWINQRVALTVRVATEGELPRAGEALFAPDDRHLRVRSGGTIELLASGPVRGVRPSADLLFASMAKVHGAGVVAVVLTGMGDDGAEGVRLVHAAGGRAFAQDEESSVVYGMPKEAAATGCIEQIVPLDKIAELLVTLTRDEVGTR